MKQPSEIVAEYFKIYNDRGFTITEKYLHNFILAEEKKAAKNFQKLKLPKTASKEAYCLYWIRLALDRDLAIKSGRD